MLGGHSGADTPRRRCGHLRDGWVGAVTSSLRTVVLIGDMYINGSMIGEDSHATVEIAGEASGIANIPLSVVVKQKGLPNVTMVELPGITRVAVRDQPKDIH
ncbi:hypothetical protein Tco_0638524 [Tanacetum coccineum]